jgi:hypothetical protein
VLPLPALFAAPGLRDRVAPPDFLNAVLHIRNYSRGKSAGRRRDLKPYSSTVNTTGCSIIESFFAVSSIR